jgi:mannose-6-phosphate isomerase-like protein (cupin superfamily)
MDSVRNLHAALATFTDQWQPHRLASINDYDVKIAKLQGEFVWHTHPDTDELFLVLDGELTIQLRTGDVVLRPGDVFVVPRGVEHNPKAEVETSIVLFEPKGTPNTGDRPGERSADLREPA